jgi:hypothetical protein
MGGEAPDDPSVSFENMNDRYRRYGTAKSKPYDQYFEEAAKKYNVDPKLLKAIAAAESSWDQNASPGWRSRVNAGYAFNFRDGEKPFDPRDNIMAGARVFGPCNSLAVILTRRFVITTEGYVVEALRMSPTLGE